MHAVIGLVAMVISLGYPTTELGGQSISEYSWVTTSE